MLRERSPVMVTIKYQTNKPKVKKFISLMYKLGRVRKKYGAFRWNILQESDQLQTFVEYFMDVSWLEYLRHRQRITGEDRDLDE